MNVLTLAIETGYEGRDKALDNALFRFFSKQAVKSLKRIFVDTCKDVDLSSSSKVLVKRSKFDGVDRSFYTRYSMKYFVEVTRRLTAHQRGVIEKFGFGCLLFLDLHHIPSEFARWVAGCFDPLCSQFLLHSQPVDFSKHTVHAIWGFLMVGWSFVATSRRERTLSYLIFI